MNSEEYSNVIVDIDTSLKKKFFEYIKETMNNNREVVKDYFIMMKDIKKLYQADGWKDCYKKLHRIL